MLSIVVPEQKEKLIKQIKALTWQLQQEITEKDREIFQKSLDILKERLEEETE